MCYHPKRIVRNCGPHHFAVFGSPAFRLVDRNDSENKRQNKMNKVIWKDGKPCQESISLVPVEKPGAGDMRALQAYRNGQAHRKGGIGCMSANGKYLDGWYNPEQKVPPFLTETQVEAFNL